MNVLDAGSVRLVDHMGTDLSIVRAARVSYDAAWRAGEDEASDTRLIRYLWKNHHTTPFESVTFTFEIYAPIFVLRQWHRHRTQSYNELSARYRQLPANFYIPEAGQIGKQSTVNKQGRILDESISLEQRYRQLETLRSFCATAYTLYESLLAEGWPRELARMVLPLNIYSHMFCTMNLLNLFKFLTLRTHSHAQYEIREYANAMLTLIEPIVPVCVQAWRDNGNQ